MNKILTIILLYRYIVILESNFILVFIHKKLHVKYSWSKDTAIVMKLINHDIL